MLRETASLLRSTGAEPALAAEMDRNATQMLAQLRPLLARGDDGGWWHMLYPKDDTDEAPTKVEARFLHDFIYVGQTIADDLTDDGSAAEMVSFFERELRTPNFVRAMSQRDPSANVTGSRRADHNQWGSWDGWAGYAITALANLGRLDLAAEFARDLAANLDQGPFGQAHRVFGSGEGARGNMTRPARKDQSYSAVCSGYIADGVVRGLFGFAPTIQTTTGGDGAPALRAANTSRGFHGTLKHVRYRDGYFTIPSDARGVRAVRE